jgi:predicted DNA-binding protein
MKKKLSVLLKEDVYEKLQQLAKTEEKSLAVLLREIIYSYVYELENTKNENVN